MGILKSQVDFYVDVLVALHTDVSCCYHVSEKERVRDELTIRERIRSEGLSFLTKTLPSLGKAIDIALSSGVKFKTLSFRKKGASAIPSFLGWLLRLIIADDGTIRSDADPLAVKQFRQVCFCFYKLELPFNPESIKSVLSDFISVDAGLATELPKSYLLDEARNVISRILCNFDPVDIRPRHGPGAVSTGERTWRKMQFKRYYKSLDKWYPYSDYFYLNYGHVSDELEGLQGLRECEPLAKVVLVPKDSRGPRLISCEPLEIQWVQQGLAKALVKHIERHPLSAGRVNFTQQEINQQLAIYGSRWPKTWVTLDMKEASDRVGLHLVKELFGNTPILDYLLATRSTATKLPSGEEVKMNKFAPMGSALCFPVEALCFFALSVAAIRCRRSCSLVEAARDVYVYGDDIVVKHEDYPCVIAALESHQLLVNRSKCCTADSFRESCGVDAFKGISVTPTKFRRVLLSSIQSHSYISWIAYSNALWENNYTIAAEFIRDYLSRIFNVWTTPTKVGWPTFVREYSVAPTASKRTQRRYNRRLQRMEYFGTMATSYKEVGQGSGRCELLRCLPQYPETELASLEQRSIDFTAFEIREGIRANVYSIARRVRLKRAWFPGY